MIAGIVLATALWTAAPEPTPENSFYLMAIWDGAMTANDAQLAEQMDRLKAEFGAGNRFHRPGFAFIQPNAAQLDRICRIARDKQLVVGVILGEITHTHTADRPEFLADLRVFQWRLDGRTWEGYFRGKNDAGQVEIAEHSRDLRVVTPSRYCTTVRQRFAKRNRQRAAELKAVMDRYPGVVTVINGVIEAELAIAAASLKGPTAHNYLADYSPFAITEFRDWLRHQGQYDADAGTFAGQGAPTEITGPWTMIAGRLRSPWYDDPTPADSAGTGPTFNEHFGTDFSTWQLRSWDLTAWPQPIVDREFAVTPTSGDGYIAGGFDAPRRVEATRWWAAWSWDYDVMGKRDPPGDPERPAYGFRQVMIANFVRDTFDEFAAAGLPRELMYAHQIPFDRGGSRGLSSASTVWSGWLPASGTVGITTFGRIEPERITRYAPRWGVFEWHPLPNAAPQSQPLYDTASRDLRDYYQASCRVLFAGWWQNEGKDRHIFPLEASEFSHAIRDFLATCPDAPQ